MGLVNISDGHEALQEAVAARRKWAQAPSQNAVLRKGVQQVHTQAMCTEQTHSPMTPCSHLPLPAPLSPPHTRQTQPAQEAALGARAIPGLPTPRGAADTAQAPWRQPSPTGAYLVPEVHLDGHDEAGIARLLHLVRGLLAHCEERETHRQLPGHFEACPTAGSTRPVPSTASVSSPGSAGHCTTPESHPIHSTSKQQARGGGQVWMLGPRLAGRERRLIANRWGAAASWQSPGL